MRLSSFQIHQQATSQLQQLGAQAAQTQQQIANGRRLVTPSDDPIGAARVININQDIEAREQYLKNLDAADAQLALTDATLDQVSDVVLRIQELTLQAASDIRTQEDREFLAAEIETRFEELLGLANTRNSAGQYLFSGFKGLTAPFEYNGQDVQYVGDEGVRRVQIDRDQFLVTNDSGADVFVDLESPNANVSLSSSNSAAADLSGLSVVDQDLVNEFYPDQLVVEFRPESEKGGSPNFTVKRLSDNRPIDGLVNMTYNGAAEITAAGIAFRIDGTAQEGDTFVVETSNTQSLFDTVDGIAQGLQDVDASANPEKFQALIDRTIEGLNAATANLSRTRADIGARFARLDSVQELHEDVTLQLQGIRSDVEDLDFAQAVSDLAYQSFVLEAAQQSFIRINDLSLFNRL